ncbi:polysaccharide biosynthesis protein [Clostridium homopropionicum DSM 5847]|uniref:Polysaccharide biosynthesis protein n=1 Tax=Clostridium homopropionicum DSM 5847 TaxID=1121318 RepID=A0A0L6ZDR4_9CLOT|nr:oligosaccharide flippase family protein [Clostridium homopropionicum]KOA21121.1 polysaccharide biosynthesis protein [Clostridium homopropionicum DSM 5847]SFF96741.1 Membrane protein involved in the export of O-antigen and teichoic acid [Clostridium homopropionicum]
MDRKLSFLKNSFIYTLGDLLPKVVSLLMIPVLTKYMGKVEYGIYGYMTILLGFLSMLYILGLDGALTRFYYEYEDKGEEKKLISTIWIFLLGYNLILSILIAIFGKNFSKLILGEIPFNPYFKLLIIICFFATFASIPLVLFRLREQSVKFGLFNIITTFVNIFFIFYFVSYKTQGAEGYLKAILFTNIAFSVVYLVINIKDLGLYFSFNIAKSALKYGIPLIPHAIGAWVLMSSDRYFLNIYTSQADLGLYTLAYQFGMLVYYLIVAINKAYVPFFFKTANEEKENAPRVFQEIIKYYSVFIISIGVGLALFAKEIIIIMASNKEFYAAYKIVPLIGLAYVFNGFYYMCVNGIFYSKKTYILPFSTGASAIVALILNFILIPRYGIYGGAIATIFAYFTLFIVTYVFSQKFYYIQWDWVKLSVNTLLGLAIYGISLFNIENLFLSILYKTVLFIIYIALLFLFKILSFEKLIFFKNKLIKR